MGLDASTGLSAPQIVGLQVSPLGTYSKTVSSVADIEDASCADDVNRTHLQDLHQFALDLIEN